MVQVRVINKDTVEVHIKELDAIQVPANVYLGDLLNMGFDYSIAVRIYDAIVDCLTPAK